MFFKRTAYLLAFASTILASNGAGAETLREAAAQALQFHPSVEAALAQLDAAKAAKREQVSGYFPDVSVAATGGRVFQDNSTSRGLSVTRGDAYSYYGEGSVTMRQMLFDGLETPSRVSSAKARRMSALNTVADLRETLTLRAVQAYIEVLRTRIGLQMLTEHKRKVDNYLARIKSSVDQGGSDAAELQQASDVSSILDGIIADFEGQKRFAEANYMEVMGHMPGDDLVKPTTQLNISLDKMESVVEQAQFTHPSLLAAKFTTKAAKYDARAERAQIFPEFDGELSYLENDKRDVIGGESTDARAVVKMSWNFSTGGAQLARIKQKKLDHKQSLARMEDLKRQIERDIRLAYSEYATAKDQLDVAYQRAFLNEKLFGTYEAQFEGAKISLLQLMQAENQLLNTKLEQMNGEHRLLQAGYGVLASVGRLQEALDLDPAAGDGKK